MENRSEFAVTAAGEFFYGLLLGQYLILVHHIGATIAVRVPGVLRTSQSSATETGLSA
jgi:hypothetical protein